MLRLYYHKTLEKKHLTVDDYMLDKVLDRIKYIMGIKRFDDSKILIDADDKLPDNITLRHVVILMTCVTKNDGKFYPQIF